MDPDDLECAESEQCRGEADGDLAGAGGSADESDVLSLAGLVESMRERATELGGSFTIEARPAGGTLVRALLPVSPPATTEKTPAPPASATDTGTRCT